MADQKIEVRIDPNGVASATATNVEPKPNIATKPNNVKQIISAGIIINAGRQMISSTFGQVGAITGDVQLNKTITGIKTSLGIAGAFAVNPAAGALQLAATLLSSGIETGLQNRNAQISADRYKSIRGRRTDKGRIK